jgi:hypothetical protein
MLQRLTGGSPSLTREAESCDDAEGAAGSSFARKHGCQSNAATIRGGKPLCGKHAVERLEHEIVAGKVLPPKH